MNYGCKTKAEKDPIPDDKISDLCADAREQIANLKSQAESLEHSCLQDSDCAKEDFRYYYSNGFVCGESTPINLVSTSFKNETSEELASSINDIIENCPVAPTDIFCIMSVELPWVPKCIDLKCHKSTEVISDP